jgi:NADPH:quinone reductase-like Zn-dependent oxidoreductase
MKAVGYRKCLPIDQADALIDLDIAAPAAPTGRDMLVEIHAVSVNPVDTKVRRRGRGARRRTRLHPVSPR